MKKLLLVSFIAAITLTNSWSKGFGKEELINFCKNSPKSDAGKKEKTTMTAGEYAYKGGGSLKLYSNGYYILKLPRGGMLGGCSQEQLSGVISNNNLNINNFKLVKRYNSPKNIKSKQSNNSELKTIQEVEIPLSKDTKGLLTLKMGNKDYLATKPALISIVMKYADTKKTFILINYDKFSIYYFKKMPVNLEKKNIVELNDKINVFDIDDDGLNEIFIYGSSYYGVNGHVGKLAILTQDKYKDIKQLTSITTLNLAKIYYLKKENIIVVAEAIWGSQEEERKKDSHKYNIYIYDLDTFNKKILFSTEKSYKDNKGFSIESIIDKIHAKYKIYKQSQPSKKKGITKYNKEIENYLKKELKAGYSHGDEPQALDMDREYFEVVGSVLKKYLQKNGFKFLKPDEYKAKVKQKLALNVKEYTKKSKYEYIDTLASPIGSAELYLLPKQGIITLPYKMPEVVDYKKEYPKLAEFEKITNETYKKSGNTQQRVSWSSVKPSVENNLKFTLALNKYLLNDDNTQIPWLVSNAYSTMLSLYKKGNRSDKLLIKALLKEYIKDKHKPMEGYEPTNFPTLGDLILEYKKVDDKYIYVVDKVALDALSQLRKEEKSSIYIDALNKYISKHKSDKSLNTQLNKLKTFINEGQSKKAKKKSLTLPDRLYVAVPKSIGIKALEVGVASPKGRFITLYKNRDNLANLIKTNPKKFKDISLILEVNTKEMSKDNYKFYTTKQGHFAIKMIPGKYILVKGANIISSKSSISNVNKNIKQKNRFVQKVDKLLKNRKQIITTFRNLTNFDWHEVCFFDNSSLNIKFYNNHKGLRINIVLPKKYYIEESYVDGSPIREIYKNNELSKKNCWSKGTKFIIKKVNTKDGKNLIIKVKD